MLTPLLILGTALAAHPGDDVRSVAALRVGAATQAPSIDGRLDDAAWQQAEVATGFVQMEPTPGAPASQRTEARVLYTETAVYVAMRMFDSAPDSIVGQLARRDAPRLYSDWAHVVIDSYNDRRTAFRFSVNPRGVKRDVFHFNDSREDGSWDAVWDVATRVDSLGWTAEFRIPLSQLRFNSKGGAEQTWGVNFGREIARLEERSYWSPVQPNSGRFVSFAGELRGLEGLRSPRQLEMQPYALSRYTRAPGDAANPFHRANDVGTALGMDLKYGVTSDLTLTATLNPDFGQVEADPSEVNLTAFESFLSERRPFFQEGTDIFNSFELAQVDLNDGERIFYSRRIGRAPQRRLAVDGFVDAPEATTILGAAKLSGKTRDGWSIGVLSTVTAAEQARIHSHGESTTAQVEPMTSYSMARLSRDFRQGRSAVGGVFTATNRFIEEGSELDFLRSAAYVGGVDARHRFGGNYQVSGSLLGSRVEGSARAIDLTQRSSARYFQRPDATHLEYDPTRTSLQGMAANAAIEKMSGGNLRWIAFGSLRTPGFEVNDLGFQRVADAGSAIASVSYAQPKAGSVFRNWRMELASGSTWTTGGERMLTASVLNGHAQLANFWSGGGAVVRLQPALSPVALRGGPALHTPGRVLAMGGISTDQRSNVRLALEGQGEREDGTGAYRWSLGPNLNLRPSNRTSVSVGPMVSRNVSGWQYLGRQTVGGEARYLGGHLDQTTVAVTTRVNYAVTPTLSMQLYAQPFVSAGEYSDFREVGDAKARGFDERFRPIAESRLGRNPDFNVKQMRSNAVLRWEYSPGSTLFLVWSQGRQDFQPDGSFDLRRDFGRLLGRDDEHATPSTNVLLLKVSYWLDR
jgi:hypothetical protein